MEMFWDLPPTTTSSSWLRLSCVRSCPIAQTHEEACTNTRVSQWYGRLTVAPARLLTRLLVSDI
jgi:hypothetical protein